MGVFSGCLIEPPARASTQIGGAIGREKRGAPSGVTRVASLYGVRSGSMLVGRWKAPKGRGTTRASHKRMAWYSAQRWPRQRKTSHGL